MKLIYPILVGVLAALPAHAGAQSTTVKNDHLACRPERELDRAERLRASGDTKALKAFTTGAVLARTCVALKSGDSVFIEGHGKAEGIVKVRPKGSFKTYFASETDFQ